MIIITLLTIVIPIVIATELQAPGQASHVHPHIRDKPTLWGRTGTTPVWLMSRLRLLDRM